MQHLTLYALCALILLITAAPAIAIPVEPWPQEGVTNIAPATVRPAQPIQAIPTTAEQSATEDNAAKQQLMQQMGTMLQTALGGQGAEIVNSDGNSSTPSTDPSNALTISGPAGSGPGGASMVGVDGCTKEPGRLQLKYGKFPEGGCDKNVRINEEFAELMNSNFNRCVQEAGKTGPIIGNARIWHAGVMGDGDHIAKGKSMHNLGMAIDVSALQVNNKSYDFKDPIDKPFFAAFRECWGKAANNARAGCLVDNGRGKPPGTVGEEDAKHKNHLHLSLPYCPQEARAKGLYIALQRLLIGEIANAAEGPELGPQTKFFKQTLKVKAGEVVVTVKDTGGEPIGADKYIVAELKCTKPAKTRRSSELAGCAYDDIKYDSKTEMLTIHYRSSVLQNSGTLGCRKQERAKFKATCD